MNVTKNAMTILERRYLRRENNIVVETPDQMADRVAAFVSRVDPRPNEAYALFLEVIDNLEFLPNSPTLMNAGKMDAQLSACFVLPVEDHMEGIFDAIKNMAMVQKTGGGTGFSFSRLRPSGASVSSTYGVASGPVSFMRVFNAATEEVKQGGTRRGANMGILRVDHPDIRQFIACKEDGGITNFNISVALTDEFMRALVNKHEYGLVDPSTKGVVRYESATEIWDLLVQHAWRYGDPGIIFIDEINRHNPTPHIGEIEATNPCGEQPLLPNEACVLGSINLKLMIKDMDGKPSVNWKRLAKVTKIAVRFLDDVIDAQKYPLPEIEALHKGNRKIGLGVMGWADMLIQLGIPYASEEAVELAHAVAKFIQEVAHDESVALGKERGEYPNWQELCPRRRNATVTTIAPTGTISMIAGASSGVEPLFGVVFDKHVMDNDVLHEFHPLFPVDKYSKVVIQCVIDRGSANVPGVTEEDCELFRGAMEIEPIWHLKHQAAWQAHVDNAVSKTINLRNNATVEDVAGIYLNAWRMGCKGITIYRDGSKEEQVVYVGGKKASAGAIVAIAGQDIPLPEGISFEKLHTQVAARPIILSGKTAKMATAMGSLYVTLNCSEEGRPFECFIEMGRAGSDIKTFTEALARLISISMRAGLSLETIIKQLKDIRGTVYGFGPTRVQSVPDAIAKCLLELMSDNLQVTEDTLEVSKRPHFEICPECGVAAFIRESGCGHCTNCPYSDCN